MSAAAAPAFSWLLLFALGVTAARADEVYYRIVRPRLPEEVVLEPGGLASLPDGRLAVATRRGDVWVLRNPGASGEEAFRLERFASGLHEPLGLLADGDDLLVTQRSEVTRLRDLDRDGLADEYLAEMRGWGVSGNYHEYAYGPVRDSRGRLVVALNATIGKRGPGGDAWRGWAVRSDGDGGVEPICAGLRSPSGLGTNEAGDVFITDQQGEWVPTGSLLHVRDGAFFGHASSVRAASRDGSPVAGPLDLPSGATVVEVSERVPSYRLPAVWFPYIDAGRSATGIACDRTAGGFGPFAGQLFVGEFTLSGVTRVFLEEVEGEYQGACFPFVSGLACGALRLEFGAGDALFVGETNRGWNSLGPRSYAIERVEWTGETPFEMKELRALPDGFELVFTRPVDVETAGSADSYRVASHTYLYHGTYGSPEVEAETHSVRGATVTADGLRVRLAIDGARAGYVHEVRLLGVRSARGESPWHDRGWYTLNRIPRSDRGTGSEEP